MDTLPTRQIVFAYDRDRDGTVDYWVYRALVEFIPQGIPCADTDPRYLRVPRDGQYLIQKDPAVNLSGDKIDREKYKAFQGGD